MGAGERSRLVIKLKRIGGELIYLNGSYIESMEATPDTTIKIHGGTVYVVVEAIDEVLRLLREWSGAGHPDDR
jgi:flagellar protein FlbD